MPPADQDTQVRLDAFRFLDEQAAIHGEVIPKAVLDRGFDFQGTRVPLMAPQGIFKPRILELPLSFTTVPPSLRKARPYDDELGEDGVIQYRYRGEDPNHRDNVGLRRAMELRVPLVYLFGMVPGQYLPVYPVLIVGDNPEALTFSVEVEDRRLLNLEGDAFPPASTTEVRAYVTVETQRRLHQRGFRERVLKAYRERCAVCRLGHKELLYGAHILPDKHPLGDPVIPNGLSLCGLHHDAFDRNIMGISPDYEIEIREDILEETDGPVLLHGLQEIQGQVLHTPRPEDFKPDKERLGIRYQEFRDAG
jgi:putative restriction endonuclease